MIILMKLILLSVNIYISYSILHLNFKVSW